MTLNVGEKRGKKGKGGQVQRQPDSQLSQKNFGSSSFAFSVDSEFCPSAYQVILTLAAFALKSLRLLKDILEMPIRNVNWDMYNIL